MKKISKIKTKIKCIIVFILASQSMFTISYFKADIDIMTANIIEIESLNIIVSIVLIFLFVIAFLAFYKFMDQIDNQ